MRDIVIVPTYERQEYAHVCLEYLSRVEGIGDKEVWLCQDSHEDGFEVNPLHAPEDTRKLALFFGQLFGSRADYIMIRSHSTYGNSRNLIEALKRAYERGAERIFLVEDDIMVMPDIFRWHEAVLDQVNPFVSCATSLNKSAHFPINGRYAMDETFRDPNAVYISANAYSSHAVAFKRENLGELLIEIDRQLEWGEWQSGKEQDILIQHIMSMPSFPNRGSAWSYVPRAYNVGMRSYHINTGMEFNGTLEEKCAALRTTIKDPFKLREMSCNNQAVTAVLDSSPEWSIPLRVVQKYR